MSSVPAPRLCTIVKRDENDEYGFNLYKKKNTPGQFIGPIDPESPAEDAGLNDGDKLLEVNGKDVTQENHRHVVQRIREIPSEVTVLVVDNNCEEYHKEKKIKITNLLPHVLHISSKVNEKAEDKNENLAKNLQAISIIGEMPNDSNKRPEKAEESMGKLERSDSISSSSSSEKVGFTICHLYKFVKRTG